MKYGYARVSTSDQKLENQIDLLKSAGADKIFQEKYTGTTTQRPEFQKLLNELKVNDTLIVTKLDRFARNTTEALELIQKLFKQNIKVNILNMGVIDNTPTGQLIFTIFSAFAQFERDMIVTRTQEGKMYAKAHDPNFREGRPQTYSDEQIQLAYELRQQGMTYKMIERKTGISIATQKRRFKKFKKLLNFSVKIAKSMLSYGAEVYRVEDTVNRIYKSFDNIKAANILVTYNFIIVSFTYNDNTYTTMRRVVLGDRDLEKIALLNDISRKMVMGGCTLDYAFKKMKEVKAKKRYSTTSVIVALTLSAPFFAIMFGGTFKDSLVAFVIMAIQAAFITFTSKYKLTLFVSNFLGAFIATVLVLLLNKILLIHNPFSIIIMSLMPLVPGVQVTNAVRDFMAGDYLSGMIGIQAAIFVSTAIALGVVMGLKLV